MNRLELSDTATEAIAVYELAKDGFRISFSRQHLVSAGSQIRPLIAEKILFADINSPFRVSWFRSGRSAVRFIRKFKKANILIVDNALAGDPLMAVRIAEILEADYSPFAGEIAAPQSHFSWTIPNTARHISDGLRVRRIDIPRIVLNPSEANSDSIAIFFALLVAYIHKNDSLSDFQADLTRRYQKLASLVPTQQPSGPLLVSGDVEDLIREWLPNALFYHSITQRPVDLIVKSLIEQELILSHGPHLLPESIENGLDSVFELIKPESSNRQNASLRSRSADPSLEDIGDINAVSSIMDRIYNWMGPPPTPITSHPEPTMSSPGSTE